MYETDTFSNPRVVNLSASKAENDEVNRQLAETAKLGDALGKALGTALDNAVLKGKSLGDVLKTLGQQLSKMALDAAFKPLEQQIGGGVASLLNGGGLSSILNNGLPFAKGGAFSGGMPIPFASGGIVSSPMNCPLAGGQTGLMGEAGPEAIMPLTRGPDGRLGVASSGSGGQPIAITFNVSTPDAESFRRSETQMAALLSRAVALGQRNL